MDAPAEYQQTVLQEMNEIAAKHAETWQTKCWEDWILWQEDQERFRCEDEHIVHFCGSTIKMLQQIDGDNYENSPHYAYLREYMNKWANKILEDSVDAIEPPEAPAGFAWSEDPDLWDGEIWRIAQETTEKKLWELVEVKGALMDNMPNILIRNAAARAATQ